MHVIHPVKQTHFSGKREVLRLATMGFINKLKFDLRSNKYYNLPFTGLSLVIQNCATITKSRWEYLVHYRIPTPSYNVMRGLQFGYPHHFLT